MLQQTPRVFRFSGTLNIKLKHSTFVSQAIIHTHTQLKFISFTQFEVHRWLRTNARTQLTCHCLESGSFPSYFRRTAALLPAENESLPLAWPFHFDLYQRRYTHITSNHLATEWEMWYTNKKILTNLWFDRLR